jgi:RHS repeat-associated protein
VPEAAPEFPEIGGGGDTKYDAMYRTTSATASMEDRSNPGNTLYTRDFAILYDELGLTISRGVGSDEWGWQDLRGFSYTYDWANGLIERVGPDGAETTVSLDVANRVSSVVRRDPLGAPLLQANYSYFANGLVSMVIYPNGVMSTYQYDGANRVTQINHENAATLFQLTMDYVYDSRDLPLTVTESGLWIPTVTTTYNYDDRGRLVSDLRLESGQGYETYLLYEYDAGGNRTRKLDYVLNREYNYTYDVNLDPNPYDSENNRLMFYTTKQFSPPVDLSTTYYEYNEFGNVTRVMTNPTGTTYYVGTRLVYASNGSAVSYVTDESWEWDGENDPTNYNITYAREFRYDGARARYLVREMNPAGLLLSTPEFNPVAGGDTWSDYDGDIIYGDFTADAQYMTFENTRSYEPGIGRVTDPLTTAVDEYYHTDLIGSTRTMTDAAGAAVANSEAIYTAFGELVDDSASHRFGYAGAYGYQTATSADSEDPYLSFPFKHVGARYYDPNTGRFLQRDPIGIMGGLNVYEYVQSRPTRHIDPSGLGPYDSDIWPLPSEDQETRRETAKGVRIALACLAFVAIHLDLIDLPDRPDPSDDFYGPPPPPPKPKKKAPKPIPFPKPKPPRRKAASIWKVQFDHIQVVETRSDWLCREC